MSGIQAVILAGGEGIRSRPLTGNRPHVLLPVANKPILARVLDTVVEAGIRDITVVVGYRKEQVMQFLNTYPVDVKVVIQTKQVGTANALLAAKEVIHTNTLILPGDIFISADDLKALCEKPDTILSTAHTHPENYGVITQKRGCLKSIVEKPAISEHTESISCGIYYLAKKTIDAINFREVNEMPDALNALVAAGHKIRVAVSETWQDAVYPLDLLKANDSCLEKTKTSLNGAIDKSVHISGHVSIGKETVIGPNTVIHGPAVIGDFCVIEPNVVIESGTAVGSGVTIEPFCYLKHALIMNECEIGSGTRLADAVIGQGCRLANNIAVVDSAVAGDHAEIGPLSILKKCTIGNNAVIEGGKVVTGTIPDDARVI